MNENTPEISADMLADLRAQTSEELTPSDPKLLERVATRLPDLRPRPVLLNIPTWGWTGDGKTCALLTALHFCELPAYPIGLSLINDTDELTRLRSENEAYQGLDLVAAATASTERLRKLLEKFIDEPEWPAGTDEPSQYLIGVRTVKATVGYALFPDLPGGDFREMKESARTVLASAHACVILVDPQRHAAQTTDGKRYRDDIAGRVQLCAAAEIPTCVMITKSDLFDGQRQIADDVHRQLSLLVAGQSQPTLSVCRVSVITDEGPFSGPKPPAVGERRPNQLIRAWTWTIYQALKRPSEAIEGRPPQMQLRGTGRARPIDIRPTPELRSIGDFSEGPGRVLTYLTDDERAPGFAFASADGELTSVTLSMAPDAQPDLSALGSIPDWQPDLTDLRAQSVSAQLVFGPRSGANFLWTFDRTNGIRRAALPVELSCWALASARTLVGLDANGRLHSLRLHDSRWTQLDFVEGFLPASKTMGCAVLEGKPLVLACNGSTVEAVALGADGQFGARGAPSITIKFDTDTSQMTPQGLIGAVAAKNVILSRSAKPVDCGPCDPTLAQHLALAAGRDVGAFVDAEHRLTAVALLGEELRRSAPAHSPVIGGTLSGLAWAASGNVLVATFADRTWTAFRPFGLSS